MKFKLFEDFGESNQLDDFVYLSENRFSTYYRVTLEKGQEVSNRYFAYEEAAKDYYDKLIEDINNDLEYYDGYNATLVEVSLNPIEDELESLLADNSQIDDNI